MSIAHIVTLAICSLVAVGVLLGLVGGLSRTRRIVSGLRAGGDLARSLASHPAPEAAFAHRWLELDAAFQSSSAIAPAWARYAASVSTSTMPDGSGALASTIAPEDCFRSDQLAGGPWTDARISRLTGLLVTLGIFGTFIGLTLGLVEADFAGIQAIVATDAKTEALQSAMFGLLAGSSTAFVTSVAGLAGSLILTVVVRQMASRHIDTALAATSAALRTGIRVEPPNQRLLQHLERLTRLLHKSTDFTPILERIASATEAVQRTGTHTAAEAPVEDPQAPLLTGISGQLASLKNDTEALRTAMEQGPSQARGGAPEPEWARQLTAAVTALSDRPAPIDALQDPLRRLTQALDRPPPSPAWVERLEQHLGEPAPTPPWVAELSTAVARLTEHQLAPPRSAQPTPAWAAALTQATQKLSQAEPTPHTEALTQIIAHLVEQNTTLAGLRSTVDQSAQALPPATQLAEVTRVLRQIHAAVDTPAADHDVTPAVAAAKATGSALLNAITPSIEEARQVADRFAAASAEFDRATTRLDAAARSNHDAADTLRQATLQLNSRMQVLQQATAAMRTGLAHHTDASNAFTAAAATLQGVGPQIVRASDQIRLSTSSVEVTAERLSALQQASGGPQIERLVPVLEGLLRTLENRK